MTYTINNRDYRLNTATLPPHQRHQPGQRVIVIGRDDDHLGTVTRHEHYGVVWVQLGNGEERVCDLADVFPIVRELKEPKPVKAST